MRSAGGLLPWQHSEFESFTRANIRFGSKADIGLAPVDVRFTHKSGHDGRLIQPKDERAGKAAPSMPLNVNRLNGKVGMSII
jgi:hypothetical protein